MRYWYDTEFIEDGKMIELISIGIVAGDEREFYAVSNEYDPSKASQWVKDNVFPYLPLTEDHIDYDCIMSRAEIAKQLREFCDGYIYGKPEFWGYYSAYDHVALCQLFGTMMDLPTGWPMYTRDIQQWRDEMGIAHLPEQDKDQHHALADARWNRKVWMVLNHYATSQSAGG